ncbi:type I polyketide synthase [Streptomyces drozdowiczii]|uniref:Type I polyketide synthase n=1 Tax=Streptomyces drozdowiczii TaxID=202862 RepID=A0ABY6Q1A1_9ACTN|nr:type I polyketide synthase [Streptomyces drozdowiczii]UZK58022.1 type I polyketide synthase [Streptomyces drozdowiczii]
MTGPGAVAVVGIDCVFPGAVGAESFWELLVRGGDSIGELPAGRREGTGFDASVRGGFIEDIATFDNDFFTVSPREAAAMDPQHRLLLQCAWRALEDSGQSPAALAGSDTGVFVGAMGSEWAQLHMADHSRVTPQLGAGTSSCMAANRISYHLDLKGPSLAVDTACSSSLVAVHLAVNSLLAGECGTALAGGVNLVLTPSIGRVYAQMGLAAPDGRCKPFSADADGIGRSDGAGTVVLRRLEDALADGQRVYAVIRGSAVNQDGRSNGVTAPNRWSQREVVAAAYRRAGVTPDRIRFIEAHGTGTALGDIIECAALGELHAVRRPEPCAIGSVKGNLGHTEGAAGIAGLIKVALALHHRLVPASRHAVRENPQLRLAERGLSLLKAPLRLPAGEVLAGVSSFGMGGTNAHAVLAAAPRVRRTPARRTRTAAPVGVFTVSGDTPEALRRNLARQAEAVARRPRGDAAALCWTSNKVKTGLGYRAAITARDTAELATALRAAADDAQLRAGIADRAWHPPVIGFLFSGQGAQEPGMTAGLYRDSAAYRRHLDEADAALAPHLGGSVRDLILDEDPAVHRTGWAQPALFAVGYALWRTLGDLGVHPDAVLGHSVGEFAAAVAAGALTLEDAVRLIAVRARLMEELPEGGGMLSVRADEAEAREALRTLPHAVRRTVSVAAVNGPGSTVLSGALETLDTVAAALRASGIRSSGLSVSHAFHSPLTEPALDRFAESAAGVACTAPRIPFASTRYGRMLGDEPLDAAYWREQAREPVLFQAALDALMADLMPGVLIEIGPAPSSSSSPAGPDCPEEYGCCIPRPAPTRAAPTSPRPPPPSTAADSTRTGRSCTSPRTACWSGWRRTRSPPSAGTGTRRCPAPPPRPRPRTPLPPAGPGPHPPPTPVPEPLPLRTAPRTPCSEP